MASKAPIFLLVNLLFFTLVSASHSCANCGSANAPTPGTGSGGIALPTCPINTLELGVCANLLGLVNVQIGSPPTLPCCSLIANLVDLEAAVCLCTALRANILGINLNIPLSLSVLLNDCGRHWPSGFTCP